MAHLSRNPPSLSLREQETIRLLRQFGAQIVLIGKRVILENAAGENVFLDDHEDHIPRKSVYNLCDTGHIVKVANDNTSKRYKLARR